MRKRFTLSILFFYFAISVLLANNSNGLINHQATLKHATTKALAVKVNKWTKDPLQVKLIDENGAGVQDIEVIFNLVYEPEAESAYELSSYKVLTDSAGLAATHFKTGKKPGIYIITATCPSIQSDQLLSFKVTAQKKNWIFLLVVGLLGGLALFIYGMELMSEGLLNSAGEKMKSILERMTYNRYIALLAGAVTTIITQSSSATSVMVVGFVNSKLLRFSQTIGIIIGAAIGTTITAQIIAFNITDYSLLLVVIGLAISLQSKNPITKEFGKAFMGFGILFFGMSIMSDSMYPLRSHQPFVDALLHLENPYMGILLGMIFTAIIQSSSAFIGILIILSMQGLLNLEAAIPLIIGANVGTTITAILASLRTSREAKKVALAFTLYKMVGAGIIVFFIPQLIEFTKYITPVAESNEISNLANPRQLANAHTVFNIALCLLFLPFTNSFAKFVSYLLPSRVEEENKTFNTKYINSSLISTPILGLQVARQETLRMMRIVKKMANLILIPFIDKNEETLAKIEACENEVNYLRDEISEFLLAISRKDTTQSTVEESFILLNVVREFEQMADTIVGPLSLKAESWCNNKFNFTKEGEEELSEYHAACLTIINQSIKVYESFDIKKAIQTKAIYKEQRQQFYELEKLHYVRLQNKVQTSMESSKTHLEIMTLLKVISSHAMNTIRLIIDKPSTKKKIN